MRNTRKWQARPSQAGPSEQWGVAALLDDDPVRSQQEGGYKWIIPPSPNLDAEDANLIVMAHNARLLSGGESRFVFMPIVSGRTKEPMVEIVFNSETATYPIAAAYRVARQLMDTVHGAIAESFLYRFITERLYEGRDDEQARMAGYGLKSEYRAFVMEKLNQGDEIFSDTDPREVQGDEGSAPS